MNSVAEQKTLAKRPVSRGTRGKKKGFRARDEGKGEVEKNVREKERKV